MTMNSEKLKTTARRNTWWPDVSTRENARAAAKGGVAVCGIIVVLTGALATYSLFQKPILGITPLSFVDVVLFAIIGFGILKMSRVAALAGLILYLVEQAYQIATLGFRSPIVPLLFILYLVHAIRGTFAYHNLPETRSEVPAIDPGENPWTQNR